MLVCASTPPRRDQPLRVLAPVTSRRRATNDWSKADCRVNAAIAIPRATSSIFDNLPFSFPPLPSHQMPRRHSAPLPDFIPPQFAQLADSAPEGDAWLHEVKIDGYRVAAGIARGKVRMFTRRAND